MGAAPDGGGGAPSGSPWAERLARYREKGLENLVFLLPGVVLSTVGTFLSHLLFDQPWRAVFVLGPLAVVAVLLWRRVLRWPGSGAITIGRPFRAFLAVYLLLFGVAAGSSVLDWKRTLVGFEEAVPRNWLALNWVGDWRYRVVPRNRARRELVILTTSVPLSRVGGRADVGQLIGLAQANGARGIAFDFYFGKPSELDSWLCGKVRSATIPVLAGYGYGRARGEVYPQRYPDTLASCFPLDSTLGHLIGYREADNRIRSIPLLFANQEGRPALSWRIANQISPAGQHGSLPATGLLRLIPTTDSILSIPVEDLYRDTALVNLLQGRFVLVGEGAGSADTVSTPFGTVPGVTIHALAVQALLDRHYIKEAPWWASLVFLLVSCFVMTVIVSRGDPVRRVLLVAGGLTLAALLAATLAVRFWLFWVDVSYAIVGMWLLVLLTLVLRKAVQGRNRVSQ